jgi:hypothetical protein
LIVEEKWIRNQSTLTRLSRRTTQVSQRRPKMRSKTAPITTFLVSRRTKHLNERSKLVIGLATGQPFITYGFCFFHTPVTRLYSS